MTREELTQVHELLELAHGYSILQSALPLLNARADLNMPKTSPIYLAAKQLLDDELGPQEGKPSLPAYQAALGRAIDKVEAQL